MGTLQTGYSGYELHIAMNSHVFNSTPRSKTVGGRNLRRVRGRREEIRTIDGDVSIRTFSRIQRRRYVSQYRRLIDHSADAHPKRQCETGSYADIGPLHDNNQSTHAISRLV